MSESDSTADMPDNQAYIDYCRAMGIDDASIHVRIRLAYLIDVDFDGNKLVNVLDYLRNTSGVNFSVNWVWLLAAGVELDFPISMSLRDVTIEHVLRLVLAQANPVGLEPIGFAIRKGIVHISTIRDFKKERESRTFNVRHLLVPISDDATIEEIELGLVTLIYDTVGNQSDWFCYGGEVSHAHIQNGILTVKTTPEYQIDIAQLLSEFSLTDLIGREKSAAQNESGSIFVDTLECDSMGDQGSTITAEAKSLNACNAAIPAAFDTTIDADRNLSPSRIRSRAAYEWAISENGIPGAADMTYTCLFEAIVNHPAHGPEGLPDSAETFAKYLRDSRVKKNGNKGDRRPTRSVRKADGVEFRSSQRPSSNGEPD